MRIHRFTVVLDSIPDLDQTDTLYGIIDDATIASSGGVADVMFHREAETLEQAMRSAVMQIQGAGFGVKRVEMEAEAVLA
jgi:hypothetical protein